MAPRRSRGAGLLGCAALAAAFPFLMTGSEGCEALVGGDVPTFECASGPAACPGDGVCDPISRQCVAPCSRTPCASGLVCDPSSNVCVEPEGGDDSSGSAGSDGASEAPSQESGPVESGCGGGLTCACSAATSCTSGICATQDTVPGPATGLDDGTSFCTQPCCTSSDCGAGTVCFAAVSNSTGGNYCVDPAWLMRTGGTGTAVGGARCASDSDCRSGLCNTDGTCADTCCSTNASSTQCSGTECRFDTFPGLASWDQSYVAWCGSGGSRGNGQECENPSACQSELCLGTGMSTCSNACRTTADCGAHQSCAYLTIAGKSGVVAACLAGAGPKAVGEACTRDADCQSQFCDATSEPQHCSDVCFTDADCKAEVPTWRCRPEQVELSAGGSYSALLCGS